MPFGLNYHGICVMYSKSSKYLTKELVCVFESAETKISCIVLRYVYEEKFELCNVDLDIYAQVSSL